MDCERGECVYARGGGGHDLAGRHDDDDSGADSDDRVGVGVAESEPLWLPALGAVDSRSF